MIGPLKSSNNQHSLILALHKTHANSGDNSGLRDDRVALAANDFVRSILKLIRLSAPEFIIVCPLDFVNLTY